MEWWGKMEITKYFSKKKKAEICNSMGKFIVYLFFYIAHQCIVHEIADPSYPIKKNIKTCLLHFKFLATGQNRNYRGYQKLQKRFGP